MLLVSCRTTDDAMHFNLAEAEEDFFFGRMEMVGLMWCRVPHLGPPEVMMVPGLQTKERDVRSTSHSGGKG